MSPLDTGFPRDPGPRKRMLPSVTDVVRELAKTISADPAVLFKAARSAVAEELAKVKQGFEAAPLGVLVKRARLQLERDGEAMPASEAVPPPLPVFPARPAPVREAPGSPQPPAKPTAADDPFQDLASRSDLNWEKDLPIQAEDAPFRSAILPIPRRSRGPLEISAPAEHVRDRVPSPLPPPRAPVPSSGPLPLTAAPTPPAGAPLPLTYAPEEEEKAAEKNEPQPSRETRPGLADDDFDALPTEEPKPLPRPVVASAPSIPLMPPHGPVAIATPEMPPLYERLEDNTQPAMEEFHFKAPERLSPPPPRSGRKGWLVAIALVLAVAAVLAWAVREYVFKNEIVKSVAPIARKKPDETPIAPVAVPAPAPVPTPAPAAAVKPAASSAKPAPAVPKGKAALLMTPDWAGKPAVYVIHFSSTKDRESAAKEALKLGAALGAPARAVQVDLGDKGVWYRVVVGEFPDVDAARAYRAELEAKKTPGMGFVYEMRGR